MASRTTLILVTKFKRAQKLEVPGTQAHKGEQLLIITINLKNFALVTFPLRFKAYLADKATTDIYIRSVLINPIFLVTNNYNLAYSIKSIRNQERMGNKREQTCGTAAVDFNGLGCLICLYKV